MLVVLVVVRYHWSEETFLQSNLILSQGSQGYARLKDYITALKIGLAMLVRVGIR